MERVAATSLLALCVQGVFSVVKLLPHFWKRSQQGETQLLPERGRGWFWGYTPQLLGQLRLMLKPLPPHPHQKQTRETSQGSKWAFTDIQTPEIFSEEATPGDSSLEELRNRRQGDLRVTRALLIEQPLSSS